MSLAWNGSTQTISTSYTVGIEMVGKVKVKKQIATTREALRFVTVLAQFFAMFPVSGIGGPRLEFKWRSFRFYYNLLYLSILSFEISFQVVRMVNETTFIHFVPITFFTFSFISTVLYIRLATQWPLIMAAWTKVDVVMRRNEYEFPKNLQVRLKLLATVIITAALLEHSFLLAYLVISRRVTKGVDALQFFFQLRFDHVFRYVPYSVWIALLCQMVSTFSTFTWNYVDLFIMVVSIALADRFEQVATRIQRAANDKIEDRSFWKEIREDYDRLNRLCKIVDGALNHLILLSFANNLFVILVQLLNTLQPGNAQDIIGRLYFVYSFGFLIVRTAAVSLYAARVDTESKRPIDALITLPTSTYNIEIERLLMQIRMDPSCLTGRGYFRVEKSLILTVTGAILSYELIFVQFQLDHF